MRVVTGSEEVGRKARPDLGTEDGDGPAQEILSRSQHYAAWFSILEEAVDVLMAAAKTKSDMYSRFCDCDVVRHLLFSLL